MDFDIDSPEDFQDKNLRSLDELVRCPICCEIMSTATAIMKCQHNFCSICIRRHVESKKQCPICKEECFENSLATNRLVNQITSQYKASRGNLLVLDKHLHVAEGAVTPTTVNSPVPDTTPHRVDDSPQRANKAPLNRSALGSTGVRTTGASLNSPQNQTSLSNMFRIKKRGLGGAVKTVGESSSYEVSTVQKNTNTMAGSSANLEMQSCPVCGCSVPGNKINHHLDLCLKRKNREERESKKLVKKKKLPNLVWNVMTDKELRAHCKKHGLSSSGKKPELIKRLKEYTLRYNSQIDQLKQKSDQELAKEVEQLERVQQRTPPTIVGNLKTEADREAYSNKHQDQFLKLINTARKNNGDKPANRTATLVHRDEEETGVQERDDIQIIHEIQSTPKKKCHGSLREFFKSPKSSSPLNVSSPTLNSSNKVKDSQDIEEFSSSTSEIRSGVVASSSEIYSGRSNQDTLVLSPVQTSSPVTSVTCTAAKSLKSAAKSLFNSQSDPAPNESSDLFGGDDDDFDDFENDENLEKMIQSFTQVPKNQDAVKSNNRSILSPAPSPNRRSTLTFSPKTPTNNSPLMPPRLKNRKNSSDQQNIILDRVLQTEDSVYIEQEVSRLYTVQNENTNSLNTGVSKLDRLLERSYKSNRTPKGESGSVLNDSMAELLDDLSRSPVPQVKSYSASGGGMDNMESPPHQIPDIDEDDLPAFDYQSEDEVLELNSGDELPEISPVITTGVRLRKRTSGSLSPFSETPPKRGRIL